MFRRKIHKRSKINSLFLLLPALVIVFFLIMMNMASVLKTSKKVDWTGISQPIQDTLKYFVIYKEDKYVFELDRYSKSEEGRKMKWVLKNATQEELTQLVNHPHAMISSLSYDKLIHSDYNNKYELLKKAFNVTNIFVAVKEGCVVRDFLLCEFLNDRGLFLSEGNSPPPLPNYYQDKFDLSINEVSELTILLKNQIENRRKYLQIFYSELPKE